MTETGLLRAMPQQRMRSSIATMVAFQGSDRDVWGIDAPVTLLLLIILDECFAPQLSPPASPVGGLVLTVCAFGRAFAFDSESSMSKISMVKCSSS